VPAILFPERIPSVPPLPVVYASRPGEFSTLLLRLTEYAGFLLSRMMIAMTVCRGSNPSLVGNFAATGASVCPQVFRQREKQQQWPMDNWGNCIHPVNQGATSHGMAGGFARRCGAQSKALGQLAQALGDRARVLLDFQNTQGR